MTTELVHLTVADAVATITLDSPHNRNALSRQLVTELGQHLDAANADPAVRAVVLTAEGPTFCSGADLTEALAGGGAGSGPGGRAGGREEGSRALLALLRRIVALDKPVVARVHGHVRAGGIGLVGAADVAVCAEEATFAFTEARLALTPAIISLTTLPRMQPRAGQRYYLTGETFDGAEAARIGLVTRAVPVGEIDNAVGLALDGLRAGSPQGLAETKRLVNRALLAHLDEDGAAMVALSARLFGSPEASERMRAFLERRR